MDIVYLFIAFIAGLLVGVWIPQRRRRAQNRKAQDNAAKVKHLFETKEHVTNNDVEQLLGVSDATATRYLDRLQDRGLITQHGEGRGAYYTKK